MSILQDCMACRQPVGQQEWQDCRDGTTASCTRGYKLANIHSGLHRSACMCMCIQCNICMEALGRDTPQPSIGKSTEAELPPAGSSYQSNCRLVAGHMSLRYRRQHQCIIASRDMSLSGESSRDYTHAISTRPWPTSSSSSASDPPASRLACSKSNNTPSALP